MRRLTGFIPARGGSKQVVRKNLRLIAGKPLVAHAIALAKSACDRVLVSTDDPDIAAVARLSGAGVLERPPGLADDDVTVDEVVAAYRIDNDEPLLVVQPTVIGVTPQALQLFVGEWASHGMKDTRFMAVRSTHLYWEHGEPLGVFRANRQWADGIDRETRPHARVA